MIRKIIAAVIAAAALFGAAWVGCSSVQEAHDARPHRYIVERDTVF
jgi:hypothetical protein